MRDQARPAAITRASVTFDGFALSFLRNGPDRAEDRPPLVLLHGIPTGAELWRGVLERLGAAGWWGLAPDLPGYGRTTVPPDADLSLAGAAEVVAAGIERAGLGPVWLVGHDLGGGVAQILAARHPRLVTRMTLTNAVSDDLWPVAPMRPVLLSARLGLYPLVAGLGLVPNPFVRRVLDRALADPAAVSAEDRHRVFWDGKVRDRHGRRTFSRHMRALTNADTRTVAEALRRLPIPTQLIWGMNDPLLTWERAGRQLDGLLPAAAVTQLEGCGHFTPIECPARLVDTMLDWEDGRPDSVDPAAG
jgi:2-hydroxymuconate-semialdehyde hydrolase